MTHRNPNYYRIGLDPGNAGVIPWLSLWTDDLSNLAIRPISIECPKIDPLEGTTPNPMLKKAYRGRDSDLHTYLKYVAARWLQGDKSDSKVGEERLRYEAQMYFPNHDIIDELTGKFGRSCIRRGKFDVRKPQILKPRDPHVDATYGTIISVDVLGFSTSVEVGYTQPFNLLMPLLEGLTDRAVWIPFPAGVNRKHFKILDNSLSSVCAYDIQLMKNEKMGRSINPASLITVHPEPVEGSNG